MISQSTSSLPPSSMWSVNKALQSGSDATGISTPHRKKPNDRIVTLCHTDKLIDRWKKEKNGIDNNVSREMMREVDR